jgi:hypothetical protein
LPALLSTIPLAQRLNNLGTQAKPAAKDLDRLTSSLDQTGAIEFLMALLYNGTSATNMFDSVGHVSRDKPEVGGCTSYQKTPTPGCAATFNQPSVAADVAAANPGMPKHVAAQVAKVAWTATHEPSRQDQGKTVKGLLDYLIGSHP